MKKEFSTNRLEQLKKQARKMLKPGSTEDEIEACARSLDQSTMIEGSLAQSEMEDEHPSSVLPVKEVKNILAQMLKPAFATKRLQVFQMPMAVSDACGPGRMVFVAFRTDVRRRAQLVAATAVIGFLSYQSELKGLTPSCEWLEVIPEYRGEGLGPELYVGIEQHTGWTINVEDAKAEHIRAIQEARRRSRLVSQETPSKKRRRRKPKAHRRTRQEKA